MCLTLTNPYVFKIVKSFLVWLIGLLSWFKTEWNNAISATPPSSSVESQALLPQNRAEHHHPQIVASALATESDPEPGNRASTVTADQDPAHELREASDSRDFVWKISQSLLHRGAKEVDSPSTIMIVISTILFGVFVAQAIAGVFSAKIESDKAGLSSSQHCGIWQFDEDAGEEAADQDDLYNYRKEARASQYARTCYSSPDPTAPFSCGMFYNQSIAYTTKTHQTCPFASPELCLDGLYSAVSFDTGYVDASVIGINSPKSHKFRRTTSCSPLNMSEPYVLRSSQTTNDTAFHYYYGPKNDTNYTSVTSGQPFEWRVPVYSVK